MVLPGEAVLELCASAQSEVLLVAPFMKSAAMNRLLEAIPPYVQKVRCVTRWRPEEIVAGVSDLEVLDLIEQRVGATLFVHPYLHAKYFRADRRALVGSANITSRALGWSIPANLELLLPADSLTEIIQEFEKKLLQSVIEVDQTLRLGIQSAADKIKQEGVRLVAAELSETDAESSER